MRQATRRRVSGNPLRQVAQAVNTAERGCKGAPVVCFCNEHVTAPADNDKAARDAGVAACICGARARAETSGVDIIMVYAAADPVDLDRSL